MVIGVERTGTGRRRGMLCPSGLLAIVMSAAVVIALAGPSEAAAPSAAAACVTDDGALKTSATQAFFAITMRNACARPVTCVAQYSITTALGVETGQTRFALRPGTVARPARIDRLVRIRASIGGAILAKTCRFSRAHHARRPRR